MMHTSAIVASVESALTVALNITLVVAWLPRRPGHHVRRSDRGKTPNGSQMPPAKRCPYPFYQTKSTSAPGSRVLDLFKPEVPLCKPPIDLTVDVGSLGGTNRK